MNWDDLSLIVLAAFGCLTLLLLQVGEVLAKLPQIIRAWRHVRNELRNGADHDCRRASQECDDRGGPSARSTDE
ncbi:hypothetical protein OG594_10255 [Streptomyces sp. NBC_01214]|uniref:hypothetical protein n=1 Tax=Streptomyces sp. NBC_01214 TaxID=2903777 RepID=UPI0022508B82|nr:hypothetical protein [Streptomyces sp. NBC_01214]MCX4802027.1 hypothetical protein [Streptomyces sp. NBC_01214]